MGLLFADQAEAEAGTDNTKLMTPLRVAQAAALVSVPVGSVFYVASSAAPSGYLKANGATISRITYAALFAAIGTTFGAGDGSTTFVLPDLRGEFVRGWDDARGVDSGRAFGSSQDDELKSHNHSILYGRSNNTSSATLGSAVGLDGSSQLSENTGGTETRPRNVALLAVIKF
jgi:microcystin-dependent protein